jgi:putative endonuclease
MAKMTYYVYILLCDDGSYYTGHTKDVESRFKQHKEGIGARYTQIHKPKKIVHVEECFSRAEAMRREKAIKNLSHAGKQKLAANSNA